MRRKVDSVTRWPRLALAVLATCLAGCSQPEVGSHTGTYTGPHTAVIIVVDTLRKDGLSLYGATRATSPELERLAADGAVYTRAYSQAPWTTPSIGSLLTSQYPKHLGIENERSPLRHKEVLISELLGQAGFATAGVASHSFASAKWGFSQGFDRFDESNIKGHDATTSEGITRTAIEMLETYADQPLFLFVHYFDPHFTFINHEGFEFREPGANDYHGVVTSGLNRSELGRLRAVLDDADKTELLRIYHSEIAFTDHHIGVLLDALRESGRYDNALIVVTADHGEEFFDHGGLGHALSLYNELINVPLVVKYPRGTGPLPGTVVEHAVALLDVYPTVADVLNVPIDHAIEGRSLLAPATEEPRAIFSETRRRSKLDAVLRGRHKLVRHAKTGATQLFDVVADPGERENLSAQEPELTRALLEELRAFGKRQGSRAAEPAELELDAEEEARLKALGYL